MEAEALKAKEQNSVGKLMSSLTSSLKMRMAVNKNKFDFRASPLKKMA